MKELTCVATHVSMAIVITIMSATLPASFL